MAAATRERPLTDADAKKAAAPANVRETPAGKPAT
jgi:hypothetical protein